MIKIIVGIVFFIFSATCFFFAYLFFRKNKDYQKNCINTTGLLKDFVPSGGFWYNPYVEIIDDGKERTLICNNVRINEENYKSLVGTTVAVSYRYKKVLGMTVCEGRLENVNLKTSTWTAGVKGLTIIGAILFLVSIVLIIMGIVG